MTGINQEMQRGAKLDSQRQNRKKMHKSVDEAGTMQGLPLQYKCIGSSTGKPGAIFYGEDCEPRYLEGTSKFLVGLEKCAAALSVTTSLVLGETSEN